MRRVLMFLLGLLMLSSCAAPAAKPEESFAVPKADTPAEAAETEGTLSEELPLEDRVLLTLDAPLADGRALRLEAVGKPVDEYTYGVREVRVWDGEKLVQTILSREAIEIYWGPSDGGVVSEYTSCWTPEETMEVLDLNFDGNTDLGLFGWAANNTIPYYYWMWDAGTGKYQYAFTLQGVSADPEAKELRSSFRLSAPAYETDYYRPDETGALCLNRVLIENWEASGLADQETWVPRPEQRFAPGAPDWSYHDLLLIRREIPIAEVQEDNTVSHYTEIWELQNGELTMTSRKEDFHENQP